MIICIESNGAGIRIVPLLNNSTCDIITPFMSSVTATANYTLEVPTLRDFPDIEQYVDNLDFIGHFIFMSGRIRMSWNAWISKYIYWEPLKLSDSKDKPLLARMRHFSGFVCHNRGRHFDRKRR